MNKHDDPADKDGHKPDKPIPPPPAGGGGKHDKKGNGGKK